MSIALASVSCALVTSSSQRRDELATAQSHTERDVNSGWGTCKTLDRHAINITFCATAVWPSGCGTSIGSSTPSVGFNQLVDYLFFSVSTNRLKHPQKCR